MQRRSAVRQQRSGGDHDRQDHHEPLDGPLLTGTGPTAGAEVLVLEYSCRETERANWKIADFYLRTLSTLPVHSVHYMRVVMARTCVPLMYLAAIRRHVERK